MVSYPMVQHIAPRYNSIALMLMCPVVALHPMRIPKLKVMPRKACGHHVIRFMSGYVAISGIVTNPKITVVKLNCNNIMKPNSSKVARNKRALFAGIAPLAMGRFLVRSTSLSRSRSHKSLMTQPAPRMIIAPMINRAI